MRTHTVVTGLLAGALHIVACGDGLEPGGAFTEEERVALITALGFDGNSVRHWASRTIVDLAPEIGMMGPYSVLGTQALITFRDETSSSTYGFSRLDGWTELNAGSGTVSSAIAVHADFPESFPASVNTIVHPDEAVNGEMRANYIAASTEYAAVSGEFDLIASDFGAFEACPNPPEDRPSFDLVSCRYSFGTLTGSFSFDAVRLQGSGPETFSQPALSFELPAIRLAIELQLSDAASQALATRLLAADGPPMLLHP